MPARATGHGSRAGLTLQHDHVETKAARDTKAATRPPSRAGSPAAPALAGHAPSTGPQQLEIAAFMSPFVRLIICLFYPVAKPIALLLDFCLGLFLPGAGGAGGAAERAPHVEGGMRGGTAVGQSQ